MRFLLSHLTLSLLTSCVVFSSDGSELGGPDEAAELTAPSQRALVEEELLNLETSSCVLSVRDSSFSTFEENKKPLEGACSIVADLACQLKRHNEISAFQLSALRATSVDDLSNVIARGRELLEVHSGDLHKVRTACARAYIRKINLLKDKQESATDASKKVIAEEIHTCAFLAHEMVKTDLDAGLLENETDLRLASDVALHCGDHETALSRLRALYEMTENLPEVEDLVQMMHLSANLGYYEEALKYSKCLVESYAFVGEVRCEDILDCMKIAYEACDWKAVLSAGAYFDTTQDFDLEENDGLHHERVHLSLEAMLNLGMHEEASTLCGNNLIFLRGGPVENALIALELSAKASNLTKFFVFADFIAKSGAATPEERARAAQLCAQMSSKAAAKKARFQKRLSALKNTFLSGKKAPVSGAKNTSSLERYLQRAKMDLSRKYMNEAKMLLSQMPTHLEHGLLPRKQAFFDVYREVMQCQKDLMSIQDTSAASHLGATTGTGSASSSSQSAPSLSPLARMRVQIERMKVLVKQIVLAQSRVDHEARAQLLTSQAPAGATSSVDDIRTPNARREVLATLGLDASYPKESEGEAGASAKKSVEVSSGAASSVFEADASLTQRPSPLAIGSVLKGTSRHTFDHVMHRTYGSVTRDHLKTLMGALKNTGHFEKAEVKDGAGSHMKVSLRRHDLEKRARPKPVVVAQFGVLKDYAIDALYNLFWLNGLTSEVD